MSLVFKAHRLLYHSTRDKEEKGVESVREGGFDGGAEVRVALTIIRWSEDVGRTLSPNADGVRALRAPNRPYTL